MQIRLRRLGPRTGRDPGAMSGSILLCDSCLRRPDAYTLALVDQAAELAGVVAKPAKLRGPGLFAAQVAAEMAMR